MLLQNFVSSETSTEAVWHSFQGLSELLPDDRKTPEDNFSPGSPGAGSAAGLSDSGVSGGKDSAQLWEDDG